MNSFKIYLLIICFVCNAYADLCLPKTYRNTLPNGLDVFQFVPIKKHPLLENIPYSEVDITTGVGKNEIRFKPTRDQGETGLSPKKNFIKYHNSVLDGLDGRSKEKLLKEFIKILAQVDPSFDTNLFKQPEDKIKFIKQIDISIKQIVSESLSRIYKLIEKINEIRTGVNP